MNSRKSEDRTQSPDSIDVCSEVLTKCVGLSKRIINNTNIKRYTRPELFYIRNETLSQIQPDYSLREELQFLGVWKLNNECDKDIGSNNGLNGASVTDAVVIVNQKFSSKYLTNRNRKSPSLRDSINDITTNSISCKSLHSFNPNSTYVDHRSISSSHLMPAFAKRRLHITSNISNDEFLIHNGTALSKRIEIPADVKDLSFLRHRNEDSVFDEKTSMGKYLSSNRKCTADPNERERSDFSISNSGSGFCSATSPSTVRHGNTFCERRIGSGRLFPRDINWDCRSDKHSAGKELLLSGQNRKSSDRVQEKGNGYGERRPYERKSIEDDNNSKIYSNNSKRMIYNAEYDQSIVRSRCGTRRNNQYNDRHEEPEWFSGGPTSQHDTIELRGFEEYDSKPELQKQFSSNNNKIDLVEDKHFDSDLLTRTESTLEYKKISSQKFNAVENDSILKDNTANDEKESKSIEPHDIVNLNNVSSDDFDFGTFLCLESLDNPTVQCEKSDISKNVAVIKSSRFSQWFPKQTNNEETSDINTNAERIEQHENYKSNPILEFLQRSKISVQVRNEGHCAMPSVEELEARMRKLEMMEKADQSNAKSIEVLSETSSNELREIELKTPIEERMTYPQAHIFENVESFKKLFERLESDDKQDDSNQQTKSPMLNVLQTQQIDQINNQISQHSLTPTHSLLKLSDIVNVSTIPEQQIQQPDNIIKDNTILEAQHLYQCVARGEITLDFLRQQMNNSHTTIHAKDVISKVLRESSRSVTPSTSLTNSIQSQQKVQTEKLDLHQLHISPDLNMGCQKQQQNQMPNSHMAKALFLPNQLSEKRGIPNQHHPHEPVNSSRPSNLHYHTQVIMQNALIKNKLEEQYESQKHQLNESEMQISMRLQQQKQIFGTHSIQYQQHGRSINSPTPLAFTPTSVLRKMTADKDCSIIHHQHQQHNVNNTSQHYYGQNETTNQSAILKSQHHILQQVSQPRMILGGNHTSQVYQKQKPIIQICNEAHSSNHQNKQQQHLNHNTQLKWPGKTVNQNITTGNKQIGRPILKSSVPLSQPQQSQQAPQIVFAPKIECQQVQVEPHSRIRNNPTPQHMFNLSSHHVHPNSFPNAVLKPCQSTQNNIIIHVQQQQQQIFQQQQRNLVIQRQHVHMHHQVLQDNTLQRDTSSRIFVGDCNVGNLNKVSSYTNCQRDGGISPTSNQLAQWFTPELLAQASALKLPPPPQTLSLEEFERSIQHSSTPVHK